MKCTYGISDMLPDQFADLLPRSATATFDFTIKADVVLIPTVDLLKLHFAALERRRTISVFVFDTEEHLRNWKIPVIESTRPAVRKALLAPNTILYKPRNPIKTLLAGSTASFVSTLNTLAYKVRDLQKRQEIIDCMFLSMYQDKAEALAEKLNAPELVKMLRSDDALRLINALQLVRKGQSAKQAATACKISSFDVQYVLKYIERMDKL